MDVKKNLTTAMALGIAFSGLGSAPSLWQMEKPKRGQKGLKAKRKSERQNKKRGRK